MYNFKKPSLSLTQAARSQSLPITTITIALMVIAAAALVMLMVRSAVDVSRHFDAWWYHLPWAARLVDLIPANGFLFEPTAAARYEGVPLLAEFLQGLFWKITGFVQAANFVSFFSLIIFIAFLYYYFSVPWFLSTLALLAIPLVQAHATSAYIDLPANIAAAVMMLLTFKIYLDKCLPTKWQLVLLFLAGAIAANMRMQLWVIVALMVLVLFFVLLRIALMAHNRYIFPVLRRHFWKTLMLTSAALLIIFFFPIKNIIVHGNPVYPLELSVAGHALNHAESFPGGGPQDQASATISQSSKWLLSVFEVGMGPINNVSRWSLDSHNVPEGSPLAKMGGYFNAYIVFHLLLFGLACIFLLKKSWIAYVLALLGLSLITMVHPDSQLLRYYMYWPIVLVALNLYIYSHFTPPVISRLLGLSFVAFLLVVVDATDQNFIRPFFYSLNDIMAERVDNTILQRIESNDHVCLIMEKPNKPFLYASYFHGESSYSIQSGPFLPAPREQIQQLCEDRRIIYESQAAIAKIQ